MVLSTKAEAPMDDAISMPPTRQVLRAVVGLQPGFSSRSEV